MSAPVHHVHPHFESKAAFLRMRAHAFCRALSTSSHPQELIGGFFIGNTTETKPTIIEHGPAWATSKLPFLGRAFEGTDECHEYFKVLGETLKCEFDESSFPDEHEFQVDGEKGAIWLTGKGKFTSLKTGRSWDETFVYSFSGLDGAGRIGRWEIWADPLSAWAAVSEEDVNGWKKGEHRG